MSELYKKFNNMSPDQLDEAVIDSCISGNIDEVKYLITCFKLKIHSNLNGEFNEIFDYACANNHFHIVKYFLHTPEFSDHIKHKNIEDGFKSACFYNRLDIIQYLIFNEKIEFNDEIKFFLDSPNLNYQPINIFKHHKDTFQNIINIFETKELEKQLNAHGSNHKEKKPKL
jgi:hypothetical protein